MQSDYTAIVGSNQWGYTVSSTWKEISKCYLTLKIQIEAYLLKIFDITSTLHFRFLFLFLGHLHKHELYWEQYTSLTQNLCMFHIHLYGQTLKVTLYFKANPPKKMSLKGNYRETDRSSKSWFTPQWLWTSTLKLGAWNSFPISHGAEGLKHHLQLPSQAH